MAGVGTFVVHESRSPPAPSTPWPTTSRSARAVRPRGPAARARTPALRRQGRAGRGPERTEAGLKDILSVELNAPSFVAALNVALVDSDGVQTLVWSRSNGPREG